VDDPIEGVKSGMPGSQLKMILGEPSHEKTYPLPQAAPTYYSSTSGVEISNPSTNH
jgi:hypothetical protein